MISAEQIKAISPHVQKLNLYLDPLNQAMRDFEINTAARVRYFLCNILHESGSFLYMQEIASGAAYEGRKDLGNIYPGDGKKYKGRGPIQITGREMYHLCGLALGLDLVSKPELLELPEYAFKAAAWFWKYKGLNELADREESFTMIWKTHKYSKIEWITVRVNGGLNGIIERKAFYAKSLIAIK